MTRDPANPFQDRSEIQRYLNGTDVDAAKLPPEILACLDRSAADDATVERVARHLEPALWAMIDRDKDDDDWCGATALNARNNSMEHARKVLASFKAEP